MSELLVELLSEEIPARMQMRAADDLKRLLTKNLAEAELVSSQIEAYATPRRLTLFASGLPEQQPDKRIEQKGPRVDAPEKAIQGFLKSIGRPNFEQCEKRKLGNAEYWFYTDLAAGQPLKRAIVDVLNDTIIQFSWPKSMRWAETKFTWVRPLHNVLAILDGAELAFEIDLHRDLNEGHAIVANNRTRGHRFLAPREFTVSSFSDYKQRLLEAKVILDPAERRDAIACKAEEAARAEGLTVKPDPGLLDEVTGLVEWPVVLTGSIDRGYMELPPEVLTTSMRAHQKYFALLTSDGQLAPRFIVVSNMETDEQGRKNIVAGNERVLRARLSDAKFFWDQDRKTRLESRLPALGTRVFHARLGTLADKVRRMESLLTKIVPAVPGGNADPARRAVLLCKADLSSGMVGEFPELQGVMGRYYALHDGAPREVADAIRDHYAPLGPNDRCPMAPTSVAVALADRVDTLAGFWTIGEKPTGSKDPFALRRAALGVIRLVIENKLRLPLRRVFKKAFAKHGAAADKVDGLIADVLAFFADRLKVHLREQGVRHDLIAAIFSRGGDSDIVRILARVEALRQFLASADGANLLTAYRRASNIVEIEEKKDKVRHDVAVNPTLLKLPEEKVLSHKLADVRQAAEQSLRAEDFGRAMTVLAELRAPVDGFFDKVTVNAPESNLRANRLRLLSEIRRTLSAVADFSKIEG